MILTDWLGNVDACWNCQRPYEYPPDYQGPCYDRHIDPFLVVEDVLINLEMQCWWCGRYKFTDIDSTRGADMLATRDSVRAELLSECHDEVKVNYLLEKHAIILLKGLKFKSTATFVASEIWKAEHFPEEKHGHFLLP